MRFQVPQFIEKESKIIGPLTLRQFGWFAGAGILFVFARALLSGVWLIMAALIFAGIATAFSFVKINEVPLPLYLFRAFGFFMSDKKYIYKKEEDTNSTEHGN